MNLIIDQGNTNIKFYIFNYDKITKFFLFPTNKIDYFFLKDINAENVIYSSVGDFDEKIIKIFSNKKFFIFDLKNIAIPVVNDYKSDSLGRDRIAGAIGAYSLFHGKNVLSIDMGTAITYDFVTKDGVYTGGNISPGMKIRFKALNDYTSKLPLVEFKEKNIFLADNTEDAILAGVVNGIVFEIETYIDKLQKKFNDLKVVLTGGDAKLFAKKIKKTIFAEPNLVAIGLNEVLKMNLSR